MRPRPSFRPRKCRKVARGCAPSNPAPKGGHPPLETPPCPTVLAASAAETAATFFGNFYWACMEEMGSLDPLLVQLDALTQWAGLETPKLVTAHERFNRMFSSNSSLIHLLRCLSFFAAYFGFHFRAEHVPGVENGAADALSRNNTVNVEIFDARKFRALWTGPIILNFRAH